jgi:hypothetical protein
MIEFSSGKVTGSSWDAYGLAFLLLIFALLSELSKVAIVFALSASASTPRSASLHKANSESVIPFLVAQLRRSRKSSSSMRGCRTLPPALSSPLRKTLISHSSTGCPRSRTHS